MRGLTFRLELDLDLDLDGIGLDGTDGWMGISEVYEICGTGCI